MRGEGDEKAKRKVNLRHSTNFDVRHCGGQIRLSYARRGRGGNSQGGERPAGIWRTDYLFRR